jgi:glutamyl-Q tRNA(Asp) synthetase
VPSPHALRFRLDDSPAQFHDRWQGLRHFDPTRLGDPVVRRRDGVFAYQLAVVVDDVHQGITDVVRGADLLDSTPWQRAIFLALGRAPPRYAHSPVVTEPDGRKLAKSRRSIPVECASPGENLHGSLHLLRQSPPPELAHAPTAEILAWARLNWNAQALENRAQIAVPEMFGSGAPLVIR